MKQFSLLRIFFLSDSGMPRYKIGDRVVGKTRKLNGRRGVVLRAHKESKQHTYDVQWENGQRDLPLEP